MELRVGDIVINPAMPQWGKGEILSIFEGKAMVRFGRHGIRKMALSFLAPEGSLPADGTSSPAASASRISRPFSFAQKSAPSPATKAPSLPRADRSAALSLFSRSRALCGRALFLFCGSRSGIGLCLCTRCGRFLCRHLCKSSSFSKIAWYTLLQTLHTESTGAFAAKY